MPVLLDGVRPGKLVTIQVRDFGKVDVDKRYQRDRIDESVNDLIYVLRRGNMVPDPITVARRLFTEPGHAEPSDKLWIIDGQQRYMAHLEVAVPLQAMVHEVESFEAERRFFLAMNTRRSVNANTWVHSWPGVTGELLRTIARTPTHALFGRINFGNQGSEKISASILVKGILSTSGVWAGGRMDRMLNRSDVVLRDPDARRRAEAFLTVIGRIWPKGYAQGLPVKCIGLVSQRRWQQHVTMPSDAVIERLKRVNWVNEAPTFADRFRPVVEACVERIWRS